MTDNNIAKVKELLDRQGCVQARIVMEARNVIPVLLDAGRTNSAKLLQEMYFELDATADEIIAVVKEDGDALAWLLERGVRPR